MRGTGKHTAPVGHVLQDAPVDNTSRYVNRQVNRWVDGGKVIHTESAREIASWYAAGSNGFAVFATTGEIPAGFVDEIKAEQRAIPNREGGNSIDRGHEILELGALRAYVRAALIEGGAR